MKNIKQLIFYCSLFLLLASCYHSDEEKDIFKFPPCYENCFNYIWGKLDTLKIMNDGLDYYKNLKPGFLPSYSSRSDDSECIFTLVEYQLAKKCFSNSCDSKFREDVLRVAVKQQKMKYSDENYISPFCAQRSGVFLMAVILAKEHVRSSKIIDPITLHRALHSFSNGDIVEEDFSNKMIRCSETFLKHSK